MTEQKRQPRKYPELPSVVWSTRYSRAKAQALYRKEGWELSPTEYWQLWNSSGFEPGAKAHHGCMIRLDRTQPWSMANSRVVQRREQFRKHFFKNCLKMPYVESPEDYVAG